MTLELLLLVIIPIGNKTVTLGEEITRILSPFLFYKLIQQLTYKAEAQGIVAIKQEESHSSKCSLLDNESIQHHKKYLGRRITSGLFKSKKGVIINADVNAGYNILKKAFLNAFSSEETADRIEDVELHPTR